MGPAGNATGMTDDMSNEKLTAIQAVVDRVTSWQDGATEGTVAEELRKGFSDAGVDVPEDQVAKLADAIESRHGSVKAEDVLSV